MYEYIYKVLTIQEKVKGFLILQFDTWRVRSQ